jgi:hypothetical protein
MQQLFTLYKSFGSGGKIKVMKGYKKKTDHKDLFAIARYFAEKGETVQITTDIHFKDEKYNHIFGKLEGTIYYHKCPDLIINGKFYEYENYTPPFKKNKISNMISKGLKQSSQIIINNNKGANHRFIRRNIYNRAVIENQNIVEIWIYEKGKVYLLYKNNRELTNSLLLVAEP